MSRTNCEKLLAKEAGLHKDEPGFMKHSNVLIDSGYKLCTPDPLHGLGCVMKNVLTMFIVCLKRNRGKVTIFSNRIAAQERFRPQGRQAFAVFLRVSSLLFD